MAARIVKASGKSGAAKTRKFECEIKDYVASGRLNHLFVVREPSAVIPGNVQGFKAGAKKFQQLFRTDADGDSIIVEAAKFCISKGELTPEEFKQWLQRVTEQAEQVLAVPVGVADAETDEPTSEQVSEALEEEMQAV
jgi:hypothetical protein